MISFFVPGIPAPAGSKKAFVLKRGGQFTGRAVITDDCKRSKPWQADVRLHAGQAFQGRALMEAPLRVSFIFKVTRPQGHFGSGKNAEKLKASAPLHPAVKPDCLKLARAVEDALSGVIYVDDSQIVQEYISKEYAQKGHQPGVFIQIEELSNQLMLIREKDSV